MKTFYHIQPTPSNEWTITHGVDGYPLTDIHVLTDGTLKKALPSSLEIVDDTTVIVRFSAPQAGTIRVIGGGFKMNTGTMSRPFDIPALLPPPGDPSFANVLALMHFDGANGATTTTNVKPGTVINFYGNASLGTAVKKFGTAALNISSTSPANGSGGVALKGAGTTFDLGANDFTLEAFIQLTSMTSGYKSASATATGATGHTIMGKCLLNTNRDMSGYRFYVDSTGALAFLYSASINSKVMSAAGLITTGQMYHVAVSRTGGEIKLFINGQVVASAQVGSIVVENINPISVGYSTDGLYSYIDMRIGYYPDQNNGTNGGLAGYIDEVRVTKGVSRYNAAFTPPTEAFKDSGPT